MKSTSALSACPGPEAVLAFMADAEHADQWFEHLDTCELCRRWVVEIERDRRSAILLPHAPATLGLADVTHSGVGPRQDASQFCDDPNAVFGPGERVGRFVIARQLGAGAFGEVFLAFDTELRRDVALKFLHHQRVWPAEITRRFRNEARALASVRHPHVVAVHDMGASSQSAAELPYLVMEYVDGGTLAGAAATQAPVATKARWLWQLCDALCALHAAEIVHNDIKPSNVLLSSDGNVKLSDFGLATRIEGFHGTIGTPAYMAPEVVAGYAATPAADQYSFAFLAAELLDGRRPSVATRPTFAGVPKAAQDALHRALAAAPTARFPSMAALRALLAPPLWYRQRNVQVLAVGAIIAAVAVGAIIAKRSTPVTQALNTCSGSALSAAQFGCAQRAGAEAGACHSFTTRLNEATDEWNAQRTIHCAKPTPTTAWQASEFCLTHKAAAIVQVRASAAQPDFPWQKANLPPAVLVPAGRCLAAPQKMPPPPPPGTYRAAADFAGLLAEFDLAVASYKPLPVSPAELVARARALNYPQMLALALDRQALLLALTDHQAAWYAFQSALAQAEIADDADARVRILTHMAMLEHVRKHDETARAYLQQARSLADHVNWEPTELLLAEVTITPDLFTPEAFRLRVADMSPANYAAIAAGYLTGLQTYDALAALVPLARELTPRCLEIGGLVSMQCASLIANVHIRTGFARTALAWGQHAQRLFYATKFNENQYADQLIDPMARAIGFGIARTEADPSAAARALAASCHDAKLCERIQRHYGSFRDNSVKELARLKMGLFANEATYAMQVALTQHDFEWLKQLLQRYPSEGRPPARNGDEHSDYYTRLYLAARLQTHQGSPPAAIAAMRAAIAYRETHLPYSPGIEDNDLDVVVLAQLLHRAGQSEEARVLLARFGAMFAEYPHLRAQLAIAKLELWPADSGVDILALRADLATFAYEDPQAAKRWQQRLAKQPKPRG